MKIEKQQEIPNKVQKIEISVLPEKGKVDVSFYFEGSKDPFTASEFHGPTRVTLDGVRYLVQKLINQIKDQPEFWGD